MTEPGWYVDHQNPEQLRYHDGTSWTDHVHPGARNLPSATPPASGSTPTAAVPPMPDAIEDRGASATDLLGIAVIGLFVGLMFGGFLFNGIGSITPVTEYPGTVDRIEIEYSGRTNTLDRATHILSGSTQGGGDWRIVDEDAYRIVEAEGYPQDVVVGIGDWSDSAERVTGESFTVDHQSTGARIAWGTVLGLLTVGGLGGAVLIGRAKSGGVLGALTFLVAYAGPGAWLGYHAFQWAQSA